MNKLDYIVVEYRSYDIIGESIRKNRPLRHDLATRPPIEELSVRRYIRIV